MAAVEKPDGQASGFGANSWLVEEMYEQFVRDPNSVSASWQEFFVDYHSHTPSVAAAAAESAEVRAVVDEFRQAEPEVAIDVAPPPPPGTTEPSVAPPPPPPGFTPPPAATYQPPGTMAPGPPAAPPVSAGGQNGAEPLDLDLKIQLEGLEQRVRARRRSRTLQHKTRPRYIRQNHRGRPANRGIRRTQRYNGDARTSRAGLSGGYTIRQSAGGGGRDNNPK